MVFLYLFLPLLLACYFLTPKKFSGMRNGILLLFSLIFYTYGGPKFLLLMLCSITINYIGGRLVTGPHKKLCMWLCVGANLGLLGWFKYASFVATSLQALFPSLAVPDIVLPIGISFFTFQGLSYVLDVYKKDAELEKNPLHVALYIALFPQLVAGPIVRYTTVSQEIRQRKENLEDFTQGAMRFLWGLGKKMMLANNLAVLADAVYATDASSLTTTLAWLGTFAYAGQIYFDFSAYSDMAIGLGRMFGFHFLENFNYPYVSKSISEFWRRWHMSLGSWFRDYVYIPLGGNRLSISGNIRNLLIIWFLTGLWHGAAYNYIIWGLYFGFLLMGENYLWGKALKRLPSFLQHSYTLLLLMISWVLFRSPDTSYILSMFSAMAGFAPGGFSDERTIYYLLSTAWVLLLSIPAALPIVPWTRNLLSGRKDRLSLFAKSYGGMLIALSLYGYAFLQLVNASFNPFIYFQF